MQKSQMLNMEQEASRQLLAYRRNRDRLAERNLGREERETLEKWSRAIAAAYTSYKRSDPERARAMVRVFGLYHPVPKYKRVGNRMVRLTNELNISEATLYRWRREMLRLVVINAIGTGALKPFEESDQDPLYPEENDPVSTP